MIARPSDCTGSPHARSAAALVVASAIVAAIILIAAATVLRVWRAEMGVALRVAVAMTPIPPFVLMFITTVRLSRKLDEMHGRIQLEALAISFALSALIVIAWGQLQKAGVLPSEEMSMAWAVMAFTYGFAYLFVWRRYQ